MSQTLSLQPGEYALFIAPPVAGVDYTGTPLPTVSYQWKKNGTAIAGQTNATIGGVKVEQTGGTVDLVDGDVISIDIILTNPVSVATKTIAATIDSAIPAPVISPVSIRQLSGGTYQTVTSLANTDIGEQVIVASNTGGTVTTTPPVLTTYQWRRNSIAIAGSTAQTYTLQSDDADSIIDCVVTAANSGGTTTATATVVVGTVADAGGWTALTPSADSRLIYVSNGGNDAAAASAKGRGYYLPSDPEIGPDPTNPVGPIVAYRNPQIGLKRLRGNGAPEWVLFRRGDSYSDSILDSGDPYWTSGGPRFGLEGIWRWAWTGSRFGTETGAFKGRSATEPFVVTAWGPTTDARPIFASGMGIPFSFQNSVIASLDVQGRAGFQFGARSDNRPWENVLIEDCRAEGSSGGIPPTFGTSETRIVFRRCVFTGNWSPTSHNQGFYCYLPSGAIVLEECVFDRNGFKDNPQQPRSWKSDVVSAAKTYISAYALHPNQYPFANQTVELWDVASNTIEWTGVMPLTDSDPVGPDEGKAAITYYEFPSPSPLVEAEPERVLIGSARWFDANQNVNQRYDIDVHGAFTNTGAKRVRIFNTVSQEHQTFDFVIGVKPQQLRTVFDRNIYISSSGNMTLRGSILARNGGGSSVQMRNGGICERNLFIWNEQALVTGSNEAAIGSMKSAIVKDNVVLHDDCFLPPGGWGIGFMLYGKETDTHVADGNVVTLFHRANNNGGSIHAMGRAAHSSNGPQSRLGNAVIVDNDIFQQNGALGIAVEPTTHNTALAYQTVGVLAARVTGNSVSSTGIMSAQGDPSLPATYTYSGAKFHAPTGAGMFRWGWFGNVSQNYRIPPYTDGTFSQWQSAGFDADGTFTTDFSSFKSAAGWTAPERDIVSYMQSVDPTYVVNEDVYADEDTTGPKQDVRIKVWEALINSSSAAMTEPQAKQAARRYHAFITFIQRAKANRKGAWDTRWTAEAVNNYIRDGFGKPPVTGAYDARGLETRILEYAS